MLKKKKYTFIFADRWLSDNRFKDWLQKVGDVHSARCFLYWKIFSIGNLGESALTIFMNGKKTSSTGTTFF